MSKILAVSSKGNMLKIEDTKEAKGYVWYFLSDEVQKYASSIGIKAGDVVEFKAEEIRGEDTIIFLKKEGGAASEFKCEKCGATLKDGRFKTCYNCNEKAKISGEKNTFYDNPERVAQIQRGNALNAAAAVASSQEFSTPEEAKKYTAILADAFLNWLRSESNAR